MSSISSGGSSKFQGSERNKDDEERPGKARGGEAESARQRGGRMGSLAGAIKISHEARRGSDYGFH